jgi:hypothetical protein
MDSTESGASSAIFIDFEPVLDEEQKENWNNLM